MAPQTVEANVAPRKAGRSIAAVVAGVIVVFVLSLGTDQLLHVFQVYPPWGQPMHDHGLNALALSYRLVYGVVGFVLSVIGAIGPIAMNVGPAWYPIALVVTALPCAWLGGILYRNRAAAP